MTPTTLTHQAAVDRIANHLADRTAYVVTVPPELMTAVGLQLAGIPGIVCYLANGTDCVFRSRNAETLIAGRLVTAVLNMPTIAVVTIPKSTPRTQIRDIFGPDLAADGSQDILNLYGPGEPGVKWPKLFLDALAKIDPGMAAQIQANHLGNLS